MHVPDANTELTYCTNVHAAESWDEVRRVLATEVRAVKARVSPERPFGVGLRLGARAVAVYELTAPARLEAARAELDAAGLYVFTLNGFPYGAFHGTRVKEQVYRPDWTEPERVRYTLSLVDALAGLLPRGACGSISTVPGCFRARSAEPAAREQMIQNLLTVAARLVELERASGQTLVLALEPEPACFLETSPEVLDFFRAGLWSGRVLSRFAELVQVERSRAEGLLRRHLGVCLDACHAAVEFEPALQVFGALRAAGIAVPKIQVSAGLALDTGDAVARAALGEFADDVYLHQVVVRAGDELRRYLDLPAALEAERDRFGSGEWRIHFHVPVFEPELGPFASTRDELRELLIGAELSESRLEVETYTFGVLPERYRAAGIAEAVARELEWTLGVLSMRERPA
jgi:sugar phosphate isomerase/epimerase